MIKYTIKCHDRDVPEDWIAARVNPETGLVALKIRMSDYEAMVNITPEDADRLVAAIARKQ